MKGGRVEFSLPNFVTSAADTIFDKLTQSNIDTVFTDLEGANVPFTAMIGIAMPREILAIEASHPVRTKQTETMATIEVVPQPFRQADGPFTMLVQVADAAVPRLWVEDTKDGHRACMLALTPEFASTSAQGESVIVALDASCSMEGATFVDAQKVASLALRALSNGTRFNVVIFGTVTSFLFPTARPKTADTLQTALGVVSGARPSRGATNLLHTVRGLAVLRTAMSLVVVSDGHLSCADELVAETTATTHLRLFMCGVGKDCNRHLMQRCSQAGRGVPFFFDSGIKSKWTRDVDLLAQYMSSACLSNIRIEWHQHSDGLAEPNQAPRTIQSLYAGCRTIVFAFAENCTSCTLHADYNGTTMSTIVSTSELAVVRGSLLHTLAARAIVRDWENGCATSSAAHDKAAKELQTQEMVNLSVDYQVRTAHTANSVVRRAIWMSRANIKTLLRFISGCNIWDVVCRS